MRPIEIARTFAGFKGNSPASMALVAVAIAGNCTTIILAFGLLYTFVKPVFMEGSVGDRRVYENLIPLFSNLMWALYTSVSHPYKPFFFIASGMGFVAQLICVFVYIYFAKGKKQTHALLLSLAVTAIALIITLLVAWMVLPDRWSSTFIDVIASVSGASVHIVPLFDLVTKRKEVKNLNPIMLLISLFGALAWTSYGCISVPVNYYVVVPNLTGIVSTAVQTIVYFRCRETRIYSVQTGTNLNSASTGLQMGKLFEASAV